MSTQFGDRPMYIGGEFVASDSGEWMDSINPATGEVHGRVPAGTVSDVDRAVKAAAAAQLEWGAKSVWERGVLLRKLADAISARAADVLPMESADTGNTIASLDNDITLACGYINFVAGLGIEIKGESVPQPLKIFISPCVSPMASLGVSCLLIILFCLPGRIWVRHWLPEIRWY